MGDFVKVYEFIKLYVDIIEGTVMEAFKDCKYKYFNSFNKWCYIYNIKFVNGKNIENLKFIVSSDDGSIKYRSGRFTRNALGDIKKLTVKFFINVSDLNICYYLETPLASSLERLFYKVLLTNSEYTNTYCYGKHTKFSNVCIHWFTHNISKDAGENNILCYEYKIDVEL